MCAPAFLQGMAFCSVRMVRKSNGEFYHITACKFQKVDATVSFLYPEMFHQCFLRDLNQCLGNYPYSVPDLHLESRIHYLDVLPIVLSKWVAPGKLFLYRDFVNLHAREQNHRRQRCKDRPTCAV